MTQAITIGEAAARVVASLGVLFDRVLDSAGEYAEALAKLDPTPSAANTLINVGDTVKILGGIMVGHYGRVTGINSERELPVRVKLADGVWFDFRFSSLEKVLP